MFVLGLVPAINTYNVHVNGLCQQNKFEDGIMMLSSTEEIGCKSNTILTAIHESGEFGKANAFLKLVKAKGVLLNSRTYDIMIKRMVNEDHISEALDLLEEMVHKSLVPEPVTYDEIICRLCENGLLSKALNLLTEMMGKNVLPGCRSWEALTVGFQIEHSFNDIKLSAMQTISAERVILPATSNHVRM